MHVCGASFGQAPSSNAGATGADAVDVDGAGSMSLAEGCARRRQLNHDVQGYNRMPMLHPTARRHRGSRLRQAIVRRLSRTCRGK